MDGTGQDADTRSEGDTAWPVVASDDYDLLGYRATVGATAGALHGAVRSILRGFGPIVSEPGVRLPAYDITSGGTRWYVRAGETVAHLGDDYLIALATLEWHIVTAALERRNDLFHLHAAALSLPTRREGILLVGDSGSGKSTLALGLMLRGFVPYGDDIALLDPQTLDLRSLRRAFHISPETWDVLGPLAGGSIRADDDMPTGYFMPPQFAERPVPVRWVLFPSYQRGRVPQLVPLTPAEAAAAILAQTTSLTRTPRLALTTATRLTMNARCYRFLSGDLAASVDVIQRLVATDFGLAPSRSELPG